MNVLFKLIKGSTEIDSYSEIKSVPILEITNPLNYIQKCPVEVC